MLLPGHLEHIVKEFPQTAGLPIVHQLAEVAPADHHNRSLVLRRLSASVNAHEAPPGFYVMLMTYMLVYASVVAGQNRIALKALVNNAESVLKSVDDDVAEYLKQTSEHPERPVIRAVPLGSEEFINLLCNRVMQLEDLVGDDGVSGSVVDVRTLSGEHLGYCGVGGPEGLERSRRWLRDLLSAAYEKGTEDAKAAHGTPQGG